MTFLFTFAVRTIRVNDMERKKIVINYTDYASIEELPADEKELLKAAQKATDNAYAPYSKFHVGAAVLLKNGEVITAANQENAAYPSGLCAERSAIFFAHSKYPDTPILKIAVTAKVNGQLTTDLTYPCGACRQVLQESQIRGGKKIKVIVGSRSTVRVLDSVECILPFAFDNLGKE